jgi:hypothetical protein
MREITEFHVHTAEGIHDGVLQCLEPATLFTLGTFVKTKKEKFFIFAEQFFFLEKRLTQAHEGAKGVETNSGEERTSFALSTLHDIMIREILSANLVETVSVHCVRDDVYCIYIFITSIVKIVRERARVQESASSCEITLAPLHAREGYAPSRYTHRPANNERQTLWHTLTTGQSFDQDSGSSIHGLAQRKRALFRCLSRSGRDC